MKVILQKDVKGTGKAGDVCEVNDGYARNFLIPRKLALPGDASSINAANIKKQADAHRLEMQRKRAKELMYQDDMTTFRNRAKVVENATIMDGGIAISTCSKDMPNNMLIAAQAADSLLSIKGIQASFVLAETPGGINISGRSLGQINVQLILERIGGGGHLAVAGAQLKDITMNEAVDKLTDSIYSYLDEIGADYSRS